MMPSEEEKHAIPANYATRPQFVVGFIYCAFSIKTATLFFTLDSSSGKNLNDY